MAITNPLKNLANQDKESPKSGNLAFESGPKRPEIGPEGVLEIPIENMPEKGQETKFAPSNEILQPSMSTSTKIIKSQTLKEVEDILSEDLEEIYFSLPQEKRTEFKQKGEETAVKISSLISQVKIKVSQILTLIKSWLKLIPGVNKFFLEQEAKIKTDKILELANKDHDRESKDLDVSDLI